MSVKQILTPEQRQRKRAANKAWKQSNAQRNQQLNREWRENNPLQGLLLTMQRNSKKRGHDLQIGLPELAKIVEPMICEVTGLPLQWGHPDWAPSIDRLDCTQGYRPGNVRLVCWFVNRALGDRGDEVFLKVCNAAVAHQKSLA